MKHLRHEGKILAEYLYSNDISREEFGKMIGLSAQMLRYHLKRELLSNKFKQKLSTLGIDIFQDAIYMDVLLLKQKKELEEKVEMLTRVVELQKQFISHVTKNCKNGVCLNFVLKKEIAN